MLDPSILTASVVHGLANGAVYALVALGLSLVYGVLHIINFAHGALLMAALYAAFFLVERLGLDPYAAIPILVPAAGCAGFLLHRYVIAKASRGREEAVLLVTLGIALVLENAALALFRSDTRTIESAWAFAMVELGPALLPAAKLAAAAGALLAVFAIWAVIQGSDLGRAIRAVAKEREAARLVGIDVEHVFALAFAIATATLGAAACLLLPTYYVSPQVGHGFVLIAFTIVVLGGMGSFWGAFWGGLLIGVVESLGGLFLGESLGQIGIFAIFIATLLLRPTGLFGRAVT
jgi:branched-chain amino acid transport system permease protein